MPAPYPAWPVSDPERDACARRCAWAAYTAAARGPALRRARVTAAKTIKMTRLPSDTACSLRVLHAYALVGAFEAVMNGRP